MREEHSEEIRDELKEMNKTLSLILIELKKPLRVEVIESAL